VTSATGQTRFSAVTAVPALISIANSTMDGAGRFHYGRQENTLDLIEEALNHIYTVRKRALAQRANQHQNVVEQRKQEADSTSILSPISRGRRPTLSSFSADKDDEEDKEKAELVSQLSTKLKAPNITAPPPPNMNLPPRAERKKKLDPNKLLEEFLSEYYTYVEKTLRDDRDVDEDTEFLTEKYFTNGLDNIPSSSEVNSIKKKISAHIEDLGSGNTYILKKFLRTYQLANSNATNTTSTTTTTTDSNILSDESAGSANATTTAGENSVNYLDAALSSKKSKSVTFSDQSDTGNSSSNNSNSKTNKSMSNAERAAAEKQRIKQQYENYMKLKRKNDMQDQKVKEYESLNEDIRSIINSIQHTAKKS
jgi:hypothetical protein